MAPPGCSRVIARRMSSRADSSGMSQSTLRSSLPGLSSAASIRSGRLVAGVNSERLGEMGADAGHLRITGLDCARAIDDGCGGEVRGVKHVVQLDADDDGRAGARIRDDLEVTTNVRMRDVEHAQQRIVDIIRRLEEQDEIIILKGGKDDVIA